MNQQKITIIGGGTAGWMTALIFQHQWQQQNVCIELVESKEIGIIGVGEGSTPALKLFFDKSDISKAFAKPTIPGTFSVPERLCLSWPPPKIIGLIGTPFLK